MEEKKSWYRLIKKIYARDGMVLIDVEGKGLVPVSLDEALDRAVAISNMSSENAITHRTTKDLHTDLMEACLEARKQQEKMKANGTYVDFALKRNNLRKMELYRAQKGIQVVR